MKKLFCFILCIGVLVSLTGCHDELKAELQTVIDTQIESEDKYTPISYDGYRNALSEAKEISEKFFVSSEELENASSKLTTAIENLYLKPDKTELEQKIEIAARVDKTKYIPNSTPVFVKAIEDAMIILEDENAVVEDVQRAITDLESGTKSLIIKPDKSELEKLLTKAENLDKNKYTTASVQELSKIVSTIKITVNNDNATADDVDAACSSLQTALNDMIKTTKGVYKISCSLYRLATNHVGNDWSSGITYNGKTIRSGDTITAPLTGSITITGRAVEHDNIPDSGSGSVTISLSGGEKSTQFYVRENRGRYAGNLAVWELTCSATLIERI